MDDRRSWQPSAMRQSATPRAVRSSQEISSAAGGLGAAAAGEIGQHERVTTRPGRDAGGGRTFMQHQHDHHTDASSGSEPEAPRKPKQEQEEATTEVTEVAPGIVRTQLPINMPGLGHVNCYVLEDERGIAVVDPGLPGPESWDHLVDRLGRAGF